MADTALADSIRQAYLAPIRTVMLVDDNFMNFAELAKRRQDEDPFESPQGERLAKPESEEDPTKPQLEENPSVTLRLKETERAASLWNACKARGWVCDIENTQFDADEVRSRIRKSDLIILDYHLDGDSALDSLRILSDLAQSDRANIVILYTVCGDLAEVRRTVAAHLREPKSVQSILKNPSEQGAWEDLAEWAPELDTSIVDSYLRGDLRSCKSNSFARSQFKARGVADGIIGTLIEAALEQYVLNLRSNFKPAIDHLHSGMREQFEMAPENSKHMWLRSGNVFVMFAQKQQEYQGADLFMALESALMDWNPPPLRTVLAYARSQVAQLGFRADADILADAPLQAGWLYHALDQGPKQGLRRLYERVLHNLSESVLSQISKFGEKLIAQPADTASGRLDQARELARVPVKDTTRFNVQMLWALNAFLCSEPYQSTHVRTGTMFCPVTLDDDDPDVLWICVTPACDMVPRPNDARSKKRWDDALYPLRPMVVLRAEQLGSPPMEDPERGRHIFFRDNDQLKAAEAIDSLSREPTLETMLVESEAVTDSKNQFCVHRIRLSTTNDVPSLQRVAMRIVGQLRPQYASRLLHQTGHHLSRLGVDFVRLPNPPDEAKSKK